MHESRTADLRTHRFTSLGLMIGCLAPLALAACSSAEIGEAPIGVSEEAVVGADCGYTVTTKITKSHDKKRFHARVKVTKTGGGRLNSTGFTVLVNTNGAELVKVGHGSFKKTENGYLLSTVERRESRHDCDDDDDDWNDPDILSGRAYRFFLTLKTPRTNLESHIISSSGVMCDQMGPAVTLTASGDLFTSNGTLALNATASDNVRVSKVVFSRDGVAIGTDTTAPYTFNESVTNALNGRHRYTATAYDLSGNPGTSGTSRVLVAIGNKFFGTATVDGPDYAGLMAHFNQVTPGNAGKWGSVEATRDVMNFTDLDTAYNFAKTNHIPFKLHTLVWGQQQPNWVAALPADEQLAELDEWMSALAERYPAVDMIDVVNEPLHAPPPYAAALGGAGATGWDWVVKSFEMARAHFPNSELLLNEYAVLTMASTTQDYLKIVNVLKERGLIDGISEQGHFYERAPEMSVMSANFGSLAATGLPLYVSELDLNFADDARQANRMKDLFSMFWSHPQVLGVTHWGYRQANMWQADAYLVRNDGSSRPALDFIECYRAGGANCTVPPIVPQPRTGDVNGITLQAEDYDSAHALLPAGSMVAYASDGSWFGFDKVVFDGNWDAFTVSYAHALPNPIALAIHLDSVDSAPIATVPLPPTGDWTTMKTASIPWAPMSGQRNVYARFVGGGGNVDKIAFSAPTGVGKNLINDSDFEGGTTAGFWSWAGGTIANTTARAVSGTHSVAMTARNGNSPLVQSLTGMVAPGKTYKVSVQASIGGATSSAYVTTALQCVGGDTTYGRLGDWGNVKTISDGSWVEFAGDLVVPDCQLANVAFWLEGPGAGVDLYLDHVSVRQVTSANIVNNGTFESGTSGWFTFNGGALSSSGARAHGGTKSLLVANRASNAPAAIDITSMVKAGKSYPFSLWASLNSPDGSTKALNVTQATSCRAADGTVSTTYNWVAGPTNVNGGASWSWVQFSGNVVIPNCTVTQVLFWVEGGAGSDLYVDDVQILDDSGTSSNLITDGTFESGQGAWGGFGFTTIGVSAPGHSGAMSLKGGGMQPNGAIARDIKALVQPGKRYTATAWVSVGNRTDGSGLAKWQTIRNCNADAGDSFPGMAFPTVANGAWVQVTGTIDLTACTTINKLILFAGADQGDLYLDDVSLTPLP